MVVQYPLGGLFGSVHHKANRNKSGHYIAICEHRASNDWFSYDDDRVKYVKFVNKNNQKVLTKFMKSAAILFYVNYTAVPVHSNNLCEHNENDETQDYVDTDEDSSSSSSTVSSSSSKQGQNNLPMKLPRLQQSICTHRMILQTILPHPSCNIVIGLWIHFLGQAMILHIKNDALVRDVQWRPALLKGAVQWCTPSATSIG